MAELVFGSVPVHGHVTPLLAVASGLVERGHRVRFLTGARFADDVAETGSTFVALPPEADFDDRDLLAGITDEERPPGVRGLRYDVREVFLRPAPHQYAALGALVAQPTDAVLVDPGFLGAGMLISRPRSQRPPVIMAGVLPMLLSSAAVPPFGLGLRPLPNAALNRVRNAALRVLVERVIFGSVQAEAQTVFRMASARPLDRFVLDWMGSADAIAQFSVPAFEYPRPDATVPLHFFGPMPASSDLPTPQWWGELDGPAPVVLVTQGTVANQDLGELVRPTVDALADSDALVVVTTGGRPVPEVGTLPSNVRAAEYLPYDQLFPKLDLLVTNGGYGGVHYALAHAVPIVVAGGGEDKPEVAARVAWSGVGVNLRTGRPKSEAIRRAVRRVLDDPSYRVAAQRVASQIAAAPGIGGLEKLILDLAAERGSDPPGADGT
ncbi:MAG TPA: nucleotide disphospho-sugar-binding domain-containing protein [Microlunatus sp.]